MIKMEMPYGTWEQEEDAQRVCAFLQDEEKSWLLLEKWLVGWIDYSQLYFLFKIFEIPVFSIKTLEAHQRHN